MSGYALNKAVYDLTRRGDRRECFAARSAFLEAYDLSEEELNALMKPDFAALLERGLLPNLLYRYYLAAGFAPAEFAVRMSGDAPSAPDGG